jgi:hypothetical protein
MLMKVIQLHIGLITSFYFTELKRLSPSLSCDPIVRNLLRNASRFKRNIRQFTTLFMNKVTYNAGGQFLRCSLFNGSI